MDELSELLSLIALATERRVLRRIVFSKPQNPADAMRVGGRLCAKGDGVVLALECTHAAGKVSHRNITESELSSALLPLCGAYDRIHILTPAGDAELCRSKRGKVTLIGVRTLAQKLTGAASGDEVATLDRQKKHLLSGDEPFLRALGISDQNGRIHDKKQAKFRQINRFLEHLRDVYPCLPQEGTLTVYDLCCGKSYLSFAVYHYLSVTMGRRVSMLGIDLKADVIAYCNEVAHASGFDGMRFVADDIRNTPQDLSPDLVISLHACDVATDLVLSHAAHLGARVILSTPCCHRYLKNRIDCAPLAFVTRQGQLSQKLCESLTDGLRLLYLASQGYSVTATELTDPDDTPKNTLLRAVRDPHFDPSGPVAERRRADYRAALCFLLGDAGAETYLTDL
ncbi:MAG: SAM-dependent methyltransferase [Clostridia bacterium]|nr:SAM-dependent methyltransferase [Clostridia bacterium]